MTTKAERLSAVRHRCASGRAREIRIRSRLAQVEVGEDIGVDASTISRWESGERAPRGTAALRYADLLDRLEASAGLNGREAS